MMTGGKIKNHKGDISPGRKNPPTHDAVSSRCCNEETAATRNSFSSESASRTSAELASEFVCSGDEKHRFAESYVVPTKSLDATGYMQPIAEDNFIRETGLPLRKENFEIDARKTLLKLKAVEDGSNGASEQIESSCSNSSTVIHPVSLSRHIHQEISKEVSTFKNCSVSLGSSNSSFSGSRMDEPVTASSESGISAQITHDVIFKDKAWNSAETEQVRESGNLLAVKGKSVESDAIMMYENNDGLEYHESEFKMIKPNKSAEKVQSVNVVGFDLNEDINNNNLDECKQPVEDNASSHSVINVVAKAGVPKGLPVAPFKFEGSLGWRGSAATSAFRPTAPSKHSFSKSSSTGHMKRFSGIDLNVAAVDDNPDAGLASDQGDIPSISPFQGSSLAVGSKQAGRLNIDLNCVSDDADECPQSSFPPEPKNVFLNLDLNYSTSTGDEFHSLQSRGQGSQSLGKMASASENAGRHDLNSSRSSYTADFNSMQVLNQAHEQSYLMQRFAPSHTKLQNSIHTLPPYTFPSSGPFYFGPTNQPTSRMYYAVPYTRDPNERALYPYFLNPGTAADVKTEGQLPASGGRREITGEFMSRAKKESMDQNKKNLHQEAWHAVNTKRKEPEGGWDFSQLGYRQVP